MRNFVFAKILFSAAVLFWLSPAYAQQCRQVGPIVNIAIDPTALADLAQIGLTREKLFDSIKQVALTETSGCWGGASGNFDDQIVSAGALQWNYGSESLPEKLRTWRTRVGANFDTELARIMPNHGQLIFSTGCLRDIITSECKTAILALLNGRNLPATLKKEFDELFETDSMIQIQMDAFVKLVGSVRDDLQRLFGSSAAPTPRQVQWAIDAKTQMKKPFVGNDTVARMRATWSTFTSVKRKAALLALVDWYVGLAQSVDQGGVIYDFRCNNIFWRQKIEAGVDEEQADLLNLTYLAGRLSEGMEGHWQALTFQRRAKIILGVGSVAENVIGIPRNHPCRDRV